MGMNMTREEREAYLAAVHVGIISIARPDRPPLAVPIWYDYDPGIGVWIITGEKSQKGRALQKTGGFSLCAQSEEPPLYKYVSVEGPATSRPADLEKDLRPMAHRYFGPELGDQYLAGQSADDSIVYTMRPERWLTIDYAKLGS